MKKVLGCSGEKQKVSQPNNRNSSMLSFGIDSSLDNATLMMTRHLSLSNPFLAPVRDCTSLSTMTNPYADQISCGTGFGPKMARCPCGRKERAMLSISLISLLNRRVALHFQRGCSRRTQICQLSSTSHILLHMRSFILESTMMDGGTWRGS